MSLVCIVARNLCCLSVCVFLCLQTSGLEQPRRKLRLWELRAMNYDETDIKIEAVKKIQQMVRIALGKSYLAREKVSNLLDMKIMDPMMPEGLLVHLLCLNDCDQRALDDFGDD